MLEEPGPAEEAALYTVPAMAEELGLPENLVRKAAKKFPFEIRGSYNRRYYSAEAMEAIGRQILRNKARRRVRLTDDAAMYWHALAALKSSAVQLAKLSRQLSAMSTELTAHSKRLRSSPPRQMLSIQTLPDPSLELASPIEVVVSPLRKIYWRARWFEAGLDGTATNPEDAVLALRERIPGEYFRLRDAPESDPARWLVMSQLIRSRQP